MGVRSWLAVGAALVFATGGLPTAAQSAVALVTARAALGSDLIDWGKNPAGSTPFGFVTADGIVGAVTSAGGFLDNRQQPLTFVGNFAHGDNLLFTEFNGPDITLNFTTPVAGAGAQIQSNFPGAFVARITASDGTTNWSFTEAGTSNGNDDGSAIFIGVLSDIANLKWVSFSLDSAAFFKNSFAINQVSLTDTVAGVPEPASWVLMLLGFGGLGATLRRRRDQVALAA